MSQRTLSRRSGRIRKAHYLFAASPLLPARPPKTYCRRQAWKDTSQPLSRTDSMNRQQLRRRLRQRRRSLSATQQRQAAIDLCRAIVSANELLSVRHLALYLPNDGEIDPSLLIPYFHKRGINLYLPVLRPYVENRLWFVRLQPDTRLARNRFGIWEPETRSAAHSSKRLPAWALNMVLMPLVGFDEQGGRLGMGGGFYDRSLSFKHVGKNTSGSNTRPALIGLAHDCQCVDKLELAPWDIPLQNIVTAQRGWLLRNKSKHLQ